MTLPARLRSLQVRLVALLALALLPLAAISVYQTAVVIDEAQATNRAALLALTKAAVSEERELMREAIGAANALSAVVSGVGLQACDRVLRAFIADQPDVVFAGHIGTDGVLGCATQGRGQSFADDPAFQDMMANPRIIIETRPDGVVLDRPVLVIRTPHLDGGVLRGMLMISIPFGKQRTTFPDQTEAGLKLAIVNAQGDVLIATNGSSDSANYLPGDFDGSRVVAELEQTFVARAGDGSTRFFAAAPIVPGTVSIVGSWPSSVIAAGQPLWRIVALSFPILMGLAGLGVAIFGLRQLVLRHVEALKSAMRRFALGDLDKGGLDLGDAPSELKEAERAFNRMVVILGEAEAQLERKAEDNEILLREVHHRVKNNLQLIASIMNMQSRAARTIEAKDILASLQSRVRGLSLLHKTLYATEDVAQVDSAQVMHELVDVIEGLAVAKDGGAQVEIDVISVPLLPDQAVPLSMLVSEALTNAVKYLGHGPGLAPRVALSLRAGEAPLDLVVEVANTLAPEVTADSDSTGLGSRLIKAFTRQLEGEIEVEQTEDLYLLRLTFTREEEVRVDD